MPRRDISFVEQVDNLEGLLRRGRRSMANPQNDGNVVPGNEDPVPRRDDNLWDSDRYVGDIPNLFVPDLNNTPLYDAIERGMPLNNLGTEYMINCPTLRQYIGTDRMRVEIPSGYLAIDTDPPIRFVAKCSDVPFQQEHLLISAMEDLVEKNAELMLLPGEDFRSCQNRMMRCFEVRDRLATYMELNSRYAQCTIKLEAALLILDNTKRQTEGYNQEVLMNRISNIIDKITTSFIRDNANRKRAKKVTLPLPKLNARATTFTSIGQVRELQEALRDEIRSIEQVAFKPADPNEDEARIVIDGDDIPDETEERQPQ